MVQYHRRYHRRCHRRCHRRRGGARTCRRTPTPTIPCAIGLRGASSRSCAAFCRAGRVLCEAPRLADHAARVEAERRTGTTVTSQPLLRVSRERPLPLSFAQQRLWFIDQLEPGSPLYNIRMTLRVEGPLASTVLARCLGEIVRRHEALRTVFAVQEGAPVQVIQPAAPFALPVVDLSGLPGPLDRSDVKAQLAFSLAAAEGSRPFDLAHGPLLRGALLRLAEEGHLRSGAHPPP